MFSDGLIHSKYSENPAGDYYTQCNIYLRHIKLFRLNPEHQIYDDSRKHNREDASNHILSGISIYFYSKVHVLSFYLSGLLQKADYGDYAVNHSRNNKYSIVPPVFVLLVIEDKYGRKLHTEKKYTRNKEAVHIYILSNNLPINCKILWRRQV